MRTGSGDGSLVKERIKWFSCSRSLSPREFEEDRGNVSRKREGWTIPRPVIRSGTREYSTHLGLLFGDKMSFPSLSRALNSFSI